MDLEELLRDIVERWGERGNNLVTLAGENPETAKQIIFEELLDAIEVIARLSMFLVHSYRGASDAQLQRRMVIVERILSLLDYRLSLIRELLAYFLNMAAAEVAIEIEPSEEVDIPVDASAEGIVPGETIESVEDLPEETIEKEDE